MKSTNASIAVGVCAVLSLASAQAHSQIQPGSGDKIAARMDAKWVSAVIGMKVVTPAGAALGNVHDVIVDGYGRATFALVSYGGVFGVGTTYTAVPWAVVAEMLDRDRLVVERAKLEKAPRLVGIRPGTADAHWRNDSENYWKGWLEASR